WRRGKSEDLGKVPTSIGIRALVPTFAFSECAPQSAIACKRYEEVASPQSGRRHLRHRTNAPKSPEFSTWISCRLFLTSASGLFRVRRGRPLGRPVRVSLVADRWSELPPFPRVGRTVQVAE